MRIVLVYPGFTKKDEFGKYDKVARTCIPLGLALIAAVLEQAGYKVYCIDTVVEQMSPQELVEKLASLNPDVIGFSILSPMLEVVKRDLKEVRKAFPHTTIIGGGAHITFYPEHTYKTFPELDVAVRGEGEETTLELIRALEKGTLNAEELRKIDGLVLPGDNGEVYLTRPRMPIQNLDDLPMPARHLFPVERYRPAAPRYKRLPSLTLYTSRGCPYRCAFCHQPEGKAVRMMSAKRVIEEMFYCREHFGTCDFEFFDNNMCVNRSTRQRLIEICKILIEEKADFTWSCQMRINNIDEELLVYMKKAGCWTIRFGIESGVSRLLDYIQKDITIEQAKQAVYIAHKVGIETNAGFIIGLPTETKEETRRTIDFAKSLPLDFAYFAIYVPKPKTKLFELAEAEGFEMEDLAYQNIWAGLGDRVPNYVPRGRDPYELARFQKQAFREFYLRPTYILKRILKLRNRFDLEKAFFGLRALIGVN